MARYDVVLQTEQGFYIHLDKAQSVIPVQRISDEMATEKKQKQAKKIVLKTLICCKPPLHDCTNAKEKARKNRWE